MAKFTVLKNTQIQMNQLGFFSDETLTNQSNDVLKSATTYFLSLNATAFIISTSIFVFRNLSAQIDIALRTAIVLLGECQSLGVFINFAVQMRNVKIMHMKLQKIADESAQDEENDASNIYWMNELKCRRFAKMMTYYIFFHLNAFAMAIIHATCDMIFGRFDTISWNTPFNVIVPFDTDLVWGWFLKWLFQFCASISYVLTATLTTSYFVGFCLYIDAICSHFNFLIRSFPRNFLLRTENPLKIQRNMWHYKNKLHQIIKIHMELYEVFQLAIEITTGTIFFFLPINGIVIGLSMYTMEHSEFNLIVFGFDIICTACTLVWLALYCYHANLATDRVASIGYSVYDLNWFEYPLDMQKYLIMIIAHSQKPVYFVGFNLIRCTLEVFAKLIRSACSFYIVFRSISQ